MRWMLVNVVWYDGVSAYVSKFIMPIDKNTEELLESGRHAVEEYVEEYISGNGKILHYDTQYPLTFKNILALEYADDNELVAAYKRFTEMYF